MPTLTDIFTGPKWNTLFGHVHDYVLHTIDSQTGLTGMAIKGGIAAANKVKPNAVDTALGYLLPDTLEILNPYWENKPDNISFGEHLENNKGEIADKLLGLGDSFAEKADNAALQKVYKSLRGKGEKIVAASLKGLGEIIEQDAKA